MSAEATREHIVGVADRLFYEQGFEATSFADIAEAVGISRGNFYYHFRTKDSILEAVIAKRLADREAMLAAWEAQADNPAGRIKLFIHILIRNQAKIMKFGCPVGTLCTELAKMGHPAQGGANAIMELFRSWLHRQFAAMGRDDAQALALQVLMQSQGVAVLANAFGDADYVASEVTRMCAAVDAAAETV